MRVQFSSTPFFVIDTAYYVKPKNDNDIKWLYYAIISNKLGEIDDGSPIPSTTRSAVYVREVEVPPIKEQKAIASILGSLDDKIDLNRRMNETLEAMARTLFRDWFVDFGPTRAKMAGEAPYLAPELWELFPDRLDDQGKPEGWQITTLGNLATNCGESIYPEQVDPLTPYVGLEHLPRRSISLSTWDRAEKITSGKSIFHEGNILFGKLRPYFHKVVIAPVNGICSTDIVVIDAKKDIWRSIVRLVCSSKDFVDFTGRTSQGTKMPRTSWGTMKAYELIQVPDNICFAFENITNTFFVKIQKNIMQSRNLAQLRDLLLPKLMSGEISIRDAEKMVEDAA
ncbi:restriction endonuclease subunit S [Acetobacter pasteurianus]|uniref:restriction endonuclease subunit S n=1 Tax=Acetobacter pasteurianus TaxID=438 RepID=UPI0009BD551E|nr:restriction endonuclease subunit S [Acetobacter pasteurianus]